MSISITNNHASPFATLRPGPPHGQAEGPSRQTALPNVADLDPETLRVIQELKTRDREVRQHEAAHLAAAGELALGGPQFTYQTGPDGRRYATGGEVQIDTSPIPGDPESTLRKADAIRRAALAPAHPSSQDQAVAAQAAQMANEAQAQLARESTAEKNPAEPFLTVKKNESSTESDTLNVYV